MRHWEYGVRHINCYKQTGFLKTVPLKLLKLGILENKMFKLGITRKFQATEQGKFTLAKDYGMEVTIFWL